MSYWGKHFNGNERLQKLARARIISYNVDDYIKGYNKIKYQ